MISLDGYIAEFIAHNMLSIGALLIALKALAENTPWEWDNKIVDVLDSIFGALVRRKNK